jgi:hypothetical protein
MNRRRRSSLLRLALVFAILLAGPAAKAQEGPAQWLGRIFDPNTLQIENFSGAELNRKLSVDAIALERGGNKRIAIFIIPPDQVRGAAEHFRQQLGAAPSVIGEGTTRETFLFDFTAANAPARLRGLLLHVERSPYVDDKGQIMMSYQPPGSP